MRRKHPLAECEKCPLQRRSCAPSIIPKSPVAAVVSRSPGRYEAQSHKPFSGPSGKVLDNLLKRNGVSRSDVLLTNVVLCELSGTKVPPEAIKACAPRLQQELHGIELVVAAGREAINVLCGRGTVDRYRGYRIPQNGRVVVATNNPALAIRDDSTFPNLKKDFQRAFRPNPPKPFPTVEVIERVDDAKRSIDKYLQSGNTVAADIESRGGLSHRATLISIQFSVEGTAATVFGEREGLFQHDDFIDNFLRPFLESTEHCFVWHNGKFDVKILRSTYGINARVDEDTILLSYALDERSGGDDSVGVHGLKYLLMEEFGWPNYESPAIEKTHKTGIVTDYDEFYDYAGKDVGGTKFLYDLYLPLAEREGVIRPYRDILLPATNDLLIPAELRGIIYDVDHAADLYEFQVNPELIELRDRMRTHIDNDSLNPNSPTQIAKVLYEDWGITHEMRSRSDKRNSVDDSARGEILAGRYSYRGATVTKRVGNRVVATQADDFQDRTANIRSFVELYDRYQKLQKQASTFLISLIEKAESDGERRIYTDLLLFGTNSGRLSSRRPNLQNITRPKEGIPNIRNLFRASRGRSIVNADFSQAELRCIAQFSHDPLLWGIYEEGRDLHSECAERFYGKDFTKHNRDVAKNVNFGVFYRQSASTFQEKHDIPESEAQPYIDWIWRTFVGVREWEKTVETEIHTRGSLTSPFGRKRRFHLITEYNKQAIYREGINFYPQTTANDFTLTSAIIIAGEIDPAKATIVLTVHDSIIGDVEDSYLDEYKTVTKQVMTSRAKDSQGWTLPFEVEIQTGESWGEVQ